MLHNKYNGKCILQSDCSNESIPRSHCRAFDQITATPSILQNDCNVKSALIMTMYFSEELLFLQKTLCRVYSCPSHFAESSDFVQTMFLNILRNDCRVSYKILLGEYVMGSRNKRCCKSLQVSATCWKLLQFILQNNCKSLWASM